VTILLDSHTFVWWLLDDRRLSRRAFAVIEQEPDIFVSAVVAWEISGKVRSGEWPEVKLLSDRFFETVAHYGLRSLPISLEHAHVAGSMPGKHRDPFDRMLAAQALSERMTLVTADPAFREFGVDVLW
jgi:PIN domain nuclease of toxin-antitoxin system